MELGCLKKMIFGSSMEHLLQLATPYLPGSFDKAPKKSSRENVKQLQGLGIHDLHFWAVSRTSS